MRIPRRAFLAGTPPALAAACRPAPKAPVQPKFEGQDPKRGHRLRDGALRGRSPDEVRRRKILIVGGGAAGLSAAWHLRRHGVDDFTILELETAAGGTARGGSSSVSAFPMGAHYLPAPHPECTQLHALLEDLGISRGSDLQGRPDYLPSAICPAPTERHLYRGIWHPGLYPAAGETQSEADQWQRWREHLRELDAARDSEGRRMFRLPLNKSSPRLRHLDRRTMTDYLDELGITSWRTRWAIDYACRDDYGTPAAQTSAFAGLHHFLARELEEGREAYLLTAPQGNARLVDGLAAKLLPEQLQLDSLVVDVDAQAGHVLVWQADGSDRVIRWEADQIIWAAPRFVLSRVLRSDPHVGATASLSYAPWLVANLSLREAPRGPGAPLAWDNVAVDQDDLGYVVATHGDHARPVGSPAQITFYQAFAGDDAAIKHARATLLAGDANYWGEHVLARLERMHSDVRTQVTDLRLHRWGHAMVRPTPGALFGDDAQRRRQSVGRVHPCSTDTRGIALFEEAFYAALAAAELSLVAIGASPSAEG